MARQASAVFRSVVAGKNVMTPYPLTYGFIGTRWVYEISEGTGFVGEPMFGISVVDAETGRLNSEMSQLFDTKNAAYEWVATYKEEYQR